MLIPDTGEVLRYLGASGADAALRERVSRTAEALAARVQPRYTCRVCELERTGAGVRFLGTAVVLTGNGARTMLEQCTQGVLLACTLGARFDALLNAVQPRDMAEAAILDACGSALVERGCDELEESLAGRFPDRYLTDRFSPGYGDLPLSLQPALCGALDAERRLGICVGESLLMHPVKSVTAVIGLSDRPQPSRIRGCVYCRLRETCTLRKGGTTCER